MAANRYKVPLKKWKKWGKPAQGVFNRCFDLFFKNQESFTHPKASEQPREHWKTVAWNTAWIAADEAQNVAELK